VHLVGFNVGIYHDARLSKSQNPFSSYRQQTYMKHSLSADCVWNE